MCAINGITIQDLDVVTRMNHSTKHRGPDGSGTYTADGITLGHNRLAIIDLSNQSAQPMISNDKRFIITYNGELYNFRELRNELRELYSFKTEGDTEVLLAAYVVWGESMFQRLKGIFSFAIWDTKNRSLILARDHMGVKPLFYRYENGIIQFSSELVAFTADHNNVINRESLSLYLSLQYVPSPHTMIKGVKKLQPGHFLKYDDGKITITDYQGTFTQESHDGHHLDIYTTIDNSVKQQLVSDRPVGIYLSGVIDSSVVLHHASKYSNGVKSFSVDFEMLPNGENEGEKFNADAMLAKKTAQHYGSDHKIFTITLQDVRDELLQVYESLDEPIADITGVPQYFLSKWVRNEGVVVALGGDGGDELFGGYNRHRALMAAYLFHQLPTFLQSGITRMYGKAQKLSLPFPVPLHLAYLASEDGYLQGSIRSNVMCADDNALFFRKMYEDMPGGTHPVDAFMRVDRRTWLPDLSLALSDRFSMAHGLELRVPLLGIDVVHVADSISIYKKVSPFRGKQILRKTYHSKLPEHIFTQPKRGWLAPGAKWLRDPVINTLVREVLSSSYYSGLDAVFDWNSVQRMLEDHVAIRGYYRQPLWNILALQIWARKNKVSL